MYRLPNHLPFLDDETLLSYAKKNQVINAGDFKSFCNHYFSPAEHMNDQLTSKSRQNRESAKRNDENNMEIYLGGMAWQTGESLPDLFIKHSMYCCLFPFIPSEQQGKLIATIFKGYPKEILSPLNRPSFPLRFCPECIKEDLDKQGIYSMYRHHQFPNVIACTKHGCTLKELSEYNPVVLPEVMDSETADSAEQDYSAFVCHFISQCSDWAHNKDFLYKLLKESGYSAKDNYAGLHEQLNSIGELGFSESELIKYLKTSFKARTCTKQQEFLRVLWALCRLCNREYTGVPPVNDSLYYALPDNWCIVSANPYTAEIISSDFTKTMYISPYLIVNGWPLPNTSLSKEKMAKAIISGVSYGKYELLDEFKNSSTPVKIRHIECGRTMNLMFRSFVTEGVRCECERTITFEEAKRNIEKDGDFKLISYLSSEKPVSIKHKSCGNVFTVSYRKFIKSPFCRHCSPKNRDTEHFIKDVHDISGEEYTVLGEYKGPFDPILFRHEFCGREFEMAPQVFLSGYRCTKCTGLIKTKDFKQMVMDISEGEYQISKEINPEVFILRENRTGKTYQLTKYRILQELTRPTPSPLLPYATPKDNLDASVRISGKNKTALTKQWIFEHCSKDQFIFLEDLPTDRFDYSVWQRTLPSMTKQGFLDSVIPGIYVFKGKEYSTDLLIENRYINRNGKVIGYLTGPSFAFKLGLCGPPKMTNIVTNKESQRHGRTVSVLGQKIKIKGAKTFVTEENADLLAILDIVQFGKKYLGSEDNQQRMADYLISKHYKLSDFSELLTLYPKHTESLLEPLMNRKDIEA